MTKILYPNPDGGICVLHSTGELPIEDVCQKDVPAGTPYLIVEDDVIPSDRSFRDDWEADFSSVTDTAMGEAAWRSANEASE